MTGTDPTGKHSKPHLFRRDEEIGAPWGRKGSSHVSFHPPQKPLSTSLLYLSCAPPPTHAPGLLFLTRGREGRRIKGKQRLGSAAAPITQLARKQNPVPAPPQKLGNPNSNCPLYLLPSPASHKPVLSSLFCDRIPVPLVGTTTVPPLLVF